MPLRESGRASSAIQVADNDHCCRSDDWHPGSSSGFVEDPVAVAYNGENREVAALRRGLRRETAGGTGEDLIAVLPFWLNLDSFSVMRLSSLVISLCIAVLLFRLEGRSLPTLLLGWAFVGASLSNLAALLEFAGPYYWQPYNLKNLVIPFLQLCAPVLAVLALLAFAYHFPHFQKPDRREYAVVMGVSVLLDLALIALTYYNFIVLQRGWSDFGFEMVYYIVFYVVVGLQFAFVVFVLLRKAARFSTGRSRSLLARVFRPHGKDARAARALALVLALPTVAFGGYVLMTVGLISPYLATYLVWVVFLVMYSSFVVSYLNHAVERTTFQIKLVGFVLVFMVGTLGMVSIFVGRAYERDYVELNAVSPGRTLHFAPNRSGSYTISWVGDRFDPQLGSPSGIGYDQRGSVVLEFPFPFYGKEYRDVQVLHAPMVFLGARIREDGWGGYHPQPAIAPFLVNLDPARGEGIYLKSLPEALTVTWLRQPQYGRDNATTVQLVLHRDGSIDFSYPQVEIVTGYSAIQMYVFTTASLTGRHPGAATPAVPRGPTLIGIHPGIPDPPLRPLRLTHDLPYASPRAEALFDAYDIAFYRYLHERMSLLVVVLIVASLSILFVLPLLFRTSLIRPLTALYTGMQSADGGDLSISVEAQSNDEIGALTRYFNRMLHSIQEAEANFRALAENAQDGILIISEEGGTVYANRAAGDLVGLSPAAVLRLPIGERLHFREPRGEGERLWKELAADRQSRHQEASVSASSGTIIPVEVTVSRMEWHGEPAYAVILRDVTERKRDEEQARAHLQRLMQTDKLTSLGVLVAGVAHEINNPNQTITANASVLNRAWPQVQGLLEELTDAEAFLIGGLSSREFGRESATMLKAIESCSARIDRIVKNLKAYSRSEPAAVLSSVDLNAVVRSAVELTGSPVRKATDRFSVSLDDSLPRIRGNAQRLEQVLINLVLNACESLPDRRCGISIRTGWDRAGDAVFVTVQDEGAGISEEDLARIREPFVTTRQDRGGTGLGLYIADTIVREHRGKLRIVSQVGKGSEVSAAFPAEEDT